VVEDESPGSLLAIAAAFSPPRDPIGCIQTPSLHIITCTCGIIHSLCSPSSALASSNQLGKKRPLALPRRPTFRCRDRPSALLISTQSYFQTWVPVSVRNLPNPAPGASEGRHRGGLPPMKAQADVRMDAEREREAADQAERVRRVRESGERGEMPKRMKTMPTRNRRSYDPVFRTSSCSSSGSSRLD